MNIKKILLVDDDYDLIEQTQLLLESKGFEVVTADSAEKGFKVFEKEKPDACVVDLIMEHHDSGFILCYKIKKTEHGKSIPVIILTSATYETGYKFSTSTKEEQSWIKSDGILNKPIIVDDLIEKFKNFYHKNN
jgi:DNA-binding response OmpR family regulator